MSGDIHFIRFVNGHPQDADSSLIVNTLSRFAEGIEQQPGITITTSDGRAEIYGLDRAESGFMGFMVTHASGQVIWDAGLAAADAAGLAIMPALRVRSVRDARGTARVSPRRTE